jgi:hypothetical protein
MSKEKGQSKVKILTKHKRAIFGKPNKIGITPLEMAAYLGKLRVFKRLLVKTEESVIDENQENKVFPYMSVRSLKFLTKVLSLILLLNIKSSFEKVSSCFSSCLYLLLQAAINPHSNALSGTRALTSLL